MYHYRLKIFILLCVGSLIIAVGRLMTLQTFQAEKARQELEDLRIRDPEQRPTVRGQILDRDEKPLALDRPAFFLHINYQLTCYMDPRWREGKILRTLAANKDKTRDEVEKELEQKWQDDRVQLEKAIDLAWQLADVSREEIEENIQQINDSIWEMRRYLGWKWKNPKKNRQDYLNECESIPLEQIVRTKLGVMNDSFPLVELKTEQDRLRTQKELLNLKALTIKTESKRQYPYGSAACQLIGWVAPWQEHEAELFKDDDFMCYLQGEVVGKWGLEKVYEPVLRGRRGEVQYDIEGNLLERTESQNGQDVRLTLDIDLQRKIERVLADNTLPHGNKYCAAVVLEVASNDILAMASIPTFDLNTIRQPDNYNHFFNPNDPNKLYQNKAIERNYPPGSTAKPLILVAGLEEKKTWPDEVISCPDKQSPAGWPNCWTVNQGIACHDYRWENTGRNAIRGSCNVYFSHLADRLDARDLQKWFFEFGYGQNVLTSPMPKDISEEEAAGRFFRQACGSIIYGVQGDAYTDFSDVPPIPSSKMSEKRFWGIGQGNLRATVLQVANALSAIVRNGLYKSPRLIYDDSDLFNENRSRQIPVSAKTLSVIRDGMHAVIYEEGGTAHSVFRNKDILNRDMTIYGKTGSTTNPNHAWFESFAEDSTGRAVVVVVLVERGESGGGEAAPLGERILDLCNRAGYVGKRPVE
jgi:penicillin-binding protein 2